MTTLSDDPIVQQTLTRALNTARAAGHAVAGLLDMDPRPLAQGVCTGCGDHLTVAYDAGPRRTPLAGGNSLRGRCSASGAWRAAADAAEALRPLAARARHDTRFLAHPLHLYAHRHGLDSTALAHRLEMASSALDRLFLSAVPPDGPSLQRVARETGARAEKLAQVLAEARALVDEDGRARRRREHAALVRETERKRDSYRELYLRAQETLDALTAEAAEDDASPAPARGR